MHPAMPASPIAYTSQGFSISASFTIDSRPKRTTAPRALKATTTTFAAHQARKARTGKRIHP